MGPGWSPIYLWDLDVQNELAPALETINSMIRLVNLGNLYNVVGYAFKGISLFCIPYL
jgi:hypothetical protein